MTDSRRTALQALAVALGTALFCALLLKLMPGFFWQDDNQIAVQAGFRDVARAYAQGDWPLLTPYSWISGNLAGELQMGTFSIFITPLVVLIWNLGLTLRTTAALYTIAHLMVLSSGAYVLARSRRIDVPFAVLVAVAATLNGWTMAWSGPDWISLLTSFAWLPWAWWAMARAQEPGASPWRFVPAGLFLYLLAAAGWPPTVIMAGLVTLVSAYRGWRQGGLATFWPLVGTWALGLALASPAYLLFYEHVSHSMRVHAAGAIWEWMVPASGWVGLLDPAAASVWLVYQFTKVHVPVEMANGLAPTVALVAALVGMPRRLWREAGPELVLLAVVMALCMAPGFAMLRWSFRWLSLVHLLIALVAGLALTAWRSEGRGNLGLVALGLAAAGLATAYFTSGTTALALPLLVLSGAWAVVAAVPALAPVKAWAPACVAVLALWATYTTLPNHLDHPVWPVPEAIRHPAPLDPQVRYLALVHQDDYFGESAFKQSFGLLVRPGCSFLYAGVEFVNGYSPLGPAGLTALLQPGLNGYLKPHVTGHLLAHEMGPTGLLQLLGVDGVVLGNDLRGEIPALLKGGWHLVAGGPEGVVLHRDGPLSPRVRSGSSVVYYASPAAALEGMMIRKTPAIPLVMVAQGGERAGETRRFAPVAVTPVRRTRLSEVVDVAAPSPSAPGLVVFSKPWFPGYEATLDGKPVPVRLVNVTMPAVVLPPGASGRLELAYRPWGLRVGGAIALGALVALLLAAILTRLARPARPAAG